LKPESVLLFWENTGERLTWKISDFKMSRVKYRRQGKELDGVIDLKKHFAHPRESNPPRYPTATATSRRGKGTCLAPGSIAATPVMSLRSDVWSLGCVSSIVFTYLEEGAAGVREYAENRAANIRADGSDRFFIRDRSKVRPFLANPVIEEWHTHLVMRAMYRSRCEF
jgi:serine/threonine protein kinase